MPASSVRQRLSGGASWRAAGAASRLAQRRLQDAQLGDGRVAEIGVDALDDLRALYCTSSAARRLDPHTSVAPGRPFGAVARRPRECSTPRGHFSRSGAV